MTVRKSSNGSPSFSGKERSTNKLLTHAVSDPVKQDHAIPVKTGENVALRIHQTRRLLQTLECFWISSQRKKSAIEFSESKVNVLNSAKIFNEI